MRIDKIVEIRLRVKSTDKTSIIFLHLFPWKWSHFTFLGSHFLYFNLSILLLIICILNAPPRLYPESSIPSSCFLEKHISEIRNACMSIIHFFLILYPRYFQIVAARFSIIYYICHVGDSNYPIKSVYLAPQLLLQVLYSQSIVVNTLTIVYIFNSVI